MTRSFLTAISGLRSHQQWLDVIGNNLANANTFGFKGSRALFSSLLNQTYSAGTPPGTSIGGVNPLQVGLGTQLGAIDRNHNQGNVDYTGRPFDLALAGNGFFTVSDGDQQLYTRAGTFGLDAANQLVDVGSGYRVLDASGQPITLDTEATVPPSETSEVTFSGNLPAEVGGPLAEQLEAGAAFKQGTAALLSGSQAGPFAVPAGETWTMSIALDGSTAQEVSVTSVAGVVTAQEIADAINLELGENIASVNGGGALELESNKLGKGSTLLVVPGSAGEDLAGLTGLASSLVTGTEDLAESTTDLNDLVNNNADYGVGDLISVSGTDAAGDPVQGTFTYGTDGTTVEDLATFIDGLYGDATATFDADNGTIQLEAETPGEAQLSLVLLDEEGQTGATNWAANAFNVSQDGTGPDVVTSSIQVFDNVGIPHLVSFEVERQADGTWSLTASLPDEDGVVLNGSLDGIAFDTDGELPGQLQLELQLQFDDQPVTSLNLNLGGDDEFAGITQYGDDTSFIAATQDGFPPGELATVSVGEDGTIYGIYSNGEDRSLGQIGVATFANDRGLLATGDSFYSATGASGQARLGNIGDAGRVIGGALEASNVDTSEQFVTLIEAQRGYQANARLISIQDRMLEESLNIL